MDRVLERARASFGGSSLAEKENIPFVPRQRSRSLGGAPLSLMLASHKRSNSVDENEEGLTPRKRARRSLVPGRSILRKSLLAPGVIVLGDDATLNLTTQNYTQTLEVSIEPEADPLRRSISRRVSFAPTAHMREFSKDEVEEASSDAGLSPAGTLQSYAAVAGHLSALTRLEEVVEDGDEVEDEDGEMSMEMADSSVTAAMEAAGYGYIAGHAHLMDETQPDFGDDSTMDLASTDVTTAFATNAAILARPSLTQRAFETAQRGILETVTSEEDLDEVAAARAHVEYNVPLGAPGIAPPSTGSDATVEEDPDAAFSSDEDDATMEMELSAGATGLVVEDGFTSRRLSTSGAVRRASLAPGLAALAMLEAADVDDDDTATEEADDVAVNEPSVPVRQQAQPIETPSKGTPRSVSRIPLSASRARPPSSLAAPSPDVLRRQTMGTPSPRRRTPVKPASVTRSPGRAISPAYVVQSVFTPTATASASIVRPEADDSPAEDAEVEERSSLDTFLELAGVQFMESMFTNPKRNSTGFTYGEGPAGALKTRVTLADQIVASGVTLPTLDMYSGMTRELRASLHEAHVFLETINQGIANGDIPPIFVEYHAATQSQRDMMTAQLKHFKNFYRTEVRSEWYDYRIACYARQGGFLEGLQDNLTRLESDRRLVQNASSQLTELLPSLQSRERDLIRDLDHERARQAELENCDQEHLGSLREAVAEQGAQLEEQNRERAEVEQDLARLTLKLSEIGDRKTEAMAAILRANAAKENIKCFTHSEVYRLRGELESHQDLQSWRLVEFSADEVKLLYRSEIGVIFRLTSDGACDVELTKLPRTSERQDEVSQHLLAFCFERMKEAAKLVIAPCDPARLLRQLANQWTAARRLGYEVSLLHHRFPIAVHAIAKKSRADAPILRLSARVFCRQAKAGFDVRFEVTGEEVVAGDPDGAIEAIGCGVEPRFGDIDREELVYLLRERVTRGGRGALLEACNEAEAKYL